MAILGGSNGSERWLTITGALFCALAYDNLIVDNSGLTKFRFRFIIMGQLVEKEVRII